MPAKKKTATPVTAAKPIAEPAAEPTKPVATPATPSPAPVAKPLSLDDQAIDLHRLIEEKEDGAAPLYFDLGAVLAKIAERIKGEIIGIGGNFRAHYWKSLLNHTEAIGLRRSRVVRAYRIYKNYKDKREEVNGLTVYEALQHKPHDKPEPKVETGVYTKRERSAAKAFVEHIGGDIDRAMDVLDQFKKNVPARDDQTAWRAAWEEIKSNRDRLWTKYGDLYHIWYQMLPPDNKIPSYKDVKADPEASLKQFRGVMQHCLTAVAAEHHLAEAGLLLDMAKIMGDTAKVAADMVDTGAGASAPTSAPVAPTSAPVVEVT